MLNFFDDYEKIESDEIEKIPTSEEKDEEPTTEEKDNTSDVIEQNSELLKLVKALSTQVDELKNELTNLKEGEKENDN